MANDHEDMDDGSSTAGQLGNTTEVINMRFQDTLKQKHKHEGYPQVRKTGVDAGHENCPQRSNM